MKNINILLVILVLAIGAFFGYRHFQGSSPTTANSTKVIWQLDASADKEGEKRRASITQVELLNETCNKLQFKVNYQSSGQTDGYLRFNVGAKPSNMAFRGDHSVTLQKGKGSSLYEVWMTNEEPMAQTDSVYVSIEEIVDNRYKDTEHFVNIAYQKSWEHSCSN
ncbi:hypothetical protein [Aliikangiella sp. G2MR2-5]|uniref:hypothetical protein n=1 Tax=Aliikangiella sp. G2MR2-5 TaxID=2788943 RepID=UPI0018A8BB88|nr:hypothetical protein [Aliikangiella sp. G2MR2-5]